MTDPITLVVFALTPNLVGIIVATLTVLALVCLTAAIHEGHRQP